MGAARWRNLSAARLPPGRQPTACGQGPTTNPSPGTSRLTARLPPDNGIGADTALRSSSSLRNFEERRGISAFRRHAESTKLEPLLLWRQYGRDCRGPKAGLSLGAGNRRGQALVLHEVAAGSGFQAVNLEYEYHGGRAWASPRKSSSFCNPAVMPGRAAFSLSKSTFRKWTNTTIRLAARRIWTPSGLWSRSWQWPI